MKIFTTIHAEINKRLQSKNEEEYLGTFKESDLDADDRDELNLWEPNGETIWEKKVGKIKFWFDLE